MDYKSIIPENYFSILDDLTRVTSEIIGKCEVKKTFHFKSGGITLGGNSIYFVKEGALKILFNSKVIRICYENEIIPIHNDSNFKYQTDFSIKISEISEEEILNKNCIIKLLEYYKADQKLNMMLLSLNLPDHPDLHFKYENFKKGDTIIEAGQKSDHIFEMIEGNAVVVSNGKKVGELFPGDIFGEISFLLDIERTASVIAHSNVIVRFLSKQSFEDAIKFNQGLYYTLAKGLAKRLVNVNKIVK
ncbi:MAG: cyclic nucleotide-binding domain-containing protein [Candidatus Delongbacteria bacterium]|nr:cyclic nucleotide-binding domain-containing protein [Candidatus Delongbacteria bacterium]MBN2836285.1 cyclic nucleotide-binding domain-containing protein [Candidatus Delongbacteria bacterium]